MILFFYLIGFCTTLFLRVISVLVYIITMCLRVVVTQHMYTHFCHTAHIHTYFIVISVSPAQQYNRLLCQHQKNVASDFTYSQFSWKNLTLSEPVLARNVANIRR